MTRYRTALLMAFVMLFASLAPTISHAVARSSGSPYTLVEACTSQGVKIFAVASDGSVVDEVPAPASAGFEHCQFCSLSLSSAPAPVAVGFVCRLDLLEPVPSVFLHAPRTPHVWLSAPARAPPLAS